MGRRSRSRRAEPGVKGEVRLVKTADGMTLRTITGHADAVCCIALSPDGQMLATGSYDQKVKLWEVATGTERRTFDGHNGAVFDVAFRPDGKTLATASADRTVKLWDVSTGERLDTLSEATKELYAVAWSPDGSRVVAAGADNRIRRVDGQPDREGRDQQARSFAVRARRHGPATGAVKRRLARRLLFRRPHGESVGRRHAQP